MFIPIIPWWAFLVIVLGWSLNSLWKKSTKTKLVEIKYGNLSEKRKHKARERADKDGYIYLGNVRRQLGAGAYWDMTMEDNVVCRVNNEKIDFYSIGDKTIFFAGVGNPESLSYEIQISKIDRIRAWYQPGGNYGLLRIDLQPFPNSECNYVKSWTSYHSKKNTTDALILIQERIETYLGKHC